MRKLVLALGFMAAATTSAAGAELGEPQMGAELAQTWCASCHLIEADEMRTVVDQVPTFFGVAKTLDDQRAEELALWLTRPHGDMPDLSLTRGQIADILAYIETLAPKN